MSAIPDLDRCWHHGCGTPDAPHEVVWKCAAGRHRLALRYCSAHIRAAMERALTAMPGGFGCAQCDGEQEIRPVLEGAPSSLPVLTLPGLSGNQPGEG